MFLFGSHCSLSLLLVSVFVCQAAQKDGLRVLDTGKSPIAKHEILDVERKDIEIYKPVVMSGHPYTFYHFKKCSSKGSKEKFRARRLDSHDDAPVPVKSKRSISRTEFESVRAIDWLIHKKKEQYAALVGESIFLAQCVKCSTNAHKELYKAGFLGEPKVVDETAKAAFECVGQVFNAREAQNYTTQASSLSDQDRS